MPAAALGVAGDLLDLVASDGLAGEGGEQVPESPGCRSGRPSRRPWLRLRLRLSGGDRANPGRLRQVEAATRLPRRDQVRELHGRRPKCSRSSTKRG